MSVSKIKSNLEQFLYTNLTTRVIKAYNTTVYTLNNVTLTQSEVNDLTEFIEPRMIPITQDRELISNPEPYNAKAFFQVSIYTKQNLGMGDSLTISDELDALYREQYIGTDNVLCEQTSLLSTFQDKEWFVSVWRVEASLWG